MSQVNRRVHLSSITAAVLLVLTACGGTTVSRPELPPRQEAADQANRKARDFLAKGDTEAALRSAERAYDLAASIEYEDGIATSRINLSIILSRLGRNAEAKSVLSPIIDNPHLGFADSRQNEAILRRAVLAIDDEDLALAASMIERASKRCLAECAFRGKIDNLAAQIALGNGQLDEAFRLAESALSMARQRQDDEEIANALRLWANAALFSSRLPEAQSRLMEALEIDKRITMPRKIFRDLILLGLVATKQGETVAARTWLLRARDVATADHFKPGIAEANSLISQLPSGKIPTADR